MRPPSLARSAVLAICLGLATVTPGFPNDPGQGAPKARQHFNLAQKLLREFEKSASLNAIRELGLARRAWEESGLYQDASRAALLEGQAHAGMGDPDAAMAAYAIGIELARQSSDPLIESELYSAFGLAQALAGDDEIAWRNAQMHCEIGSRLSQITGGELAQAHALHCQGQVLYARGNTAEALEPFRSAEAILRETDAPRVLALNLLHQGYVYSDLSAFHLADERFEEVLAIAQPLGERRTVALAQVAIARKLARQSQFQAALDRFFASREAFERMGDDVFLAASHDGIAGIYRDLGQYRNAIRHWRITLELFEEAELFGYIPYALELLGMAELALNHPGVALTYFDRAHALSVQSGSPLNQAYALRHLGFAYQELGQPRRALQYLERLLTIEEIDNLPRLRADALADMAFVEMVQGRNEAALEHLQLSEALSKGAGYRQGESRALFGRAVAQDNLGHFEMALRHIESALEVTESLRTEVAGLERKTTFSASVHDQYRLYVNLLMRAHQESPDEGYAEKAFLAMELSQARSLMESLAMSGVNLRDGVDPQLIAEEDQAREQLDEQYGRQANGSAMTDGEREALETRINELEANYQQAKARVRVSSPGYAALTRPMPVSLRQAQSDVLDQDTVLLEYVLGDERSYLWVVTHDTYEIHELPARESIETLALQAHELLSQPGLRSPQGETWAQVMTRLSQRVLPGSLPDWRTDTRHSGSSPIQRLVVVADGALRYIPFGALPMPGNAEGETSPLIVRFEVVSLPSVSTLAVLRNEVHDRPKAPGAVAVLADPVFDIDDPRLKHARDAQRGVTGTQVPLRRLEKSGTEASAILAAVEGSVGGGMLLKSGFAANRRMAMSDELGRFQVLHFATHAMFNEGEPGLSGLVLSQFDEQGQSLEGFLRLHDIYQLDLPAELVVLSACETALGNHVAGEGIVGVVRGFMYAGSKSVIASLWQAADTATATLMGRLYREMFESGAPPAAALRQAQLHVMDQPRTRHPFYWAAFTLQGEWRVD